MSSFIVFSFFAVVALVAWKLRAKHHETASENKNHVVEVPSLPPEPVVDTPVKKSRGRPKKYGGKVKREG